MQKGEEVQISDIPEKLANLVRILIDTTNYFIDKDKGKDVKDVHFLAVEDFHFDYIEGNFQEENT